MKNTDVKLQVQKVKSTGSTIKRKPVPVQDLHLEVPANTWQNMVDRLAKGL